MFARLSQYGLRRQQHTMEVTEPSVLIAQPPMSDAVERLRMDFSDGSRVFDANVLPHLVQAAAFFQALPASQKHHHARPYGALIHALEVATLALRACDVNQLLSDASGGERMGCRVAAQAGMVILALTHDVGKPETDLLVEGGGDQWRPSHESLWAFARSRRVSEVSFEWNPARTHGAHEAYTPVIAQAWLLAAQLPRMVERELVRAMTRKEGVWAEIVLAADRKSVEADRAQAHGPGAVDSVTERLMEGINEMLAAGDWSLNRPGSPLWRDEKGCCLSHPLGLNQLTQHLAAAGRLDGLPTDLMRLVRMLHSEGAWENAAHEGTPVTEAFHPQGVSAPFQVLRLSARAEALLHLPQSIATTAAADARPPVSARHEQARPRELTSPARAFEHRPMGLGKAFIQGVSRLLDDQWADENGVLWRRREDRIELAWPEALKFLSAHGSGAGAVDPQLLLQALQREAFIETQGERIVHTDTDTEQRWIQLTAEGSVPICEAIAANRGASSAEDVGAKAAKDSAQSRQTDNASSRRSEEVKHTDDEAAQLEHWLTEQVTRGELRWSKSPEEGLFVHPEGLGVHADLLRRYCQAASTHTPRTLLSALKREGEGEAVEGGYVLLNARRGVRILNDGREA